MKKVLLSLVSLCLFNSLVFAVTDLTDTEEKPDNTGCRVTAVGSNKEVASVSCRSGLKCIGRYLEVTQNGMRLHLSYETKGNWVLFLAENDGKKDTKELYYTVINSDTVVSKIANKLVVKCF